MMKSIQQLNRASTYPGECAGLHLLLLAQTNHQQSRAYANTQSGYPKRHSHCLSRKSCWSWQLRQDYEHLPDPFYAYSPLMHWSHSTALQGRCNPMSIQTIVQRQQLCHDCTMVHSLHQEYDLLHTHAWSGVILERLLVHKHTCKFILNKLKQQQFMNTHTEAWQVPACAVYSLQSLKFSGSRVITNDCGGTHIFSSVHTTKLPHIDITALHHTVH